LDSPEAGPGPVLVAEREPRLRRLIALCLEPWERQLIEAADGEDAWALLQAYRPALAILDLYLAGRNGLELVQAIRATPDLASTRVILLTAAARQRWAEAALAAGADRSLAKPFSTVDLSDAVQALVGPPSARPEFVQTLRQLAGPHPADA
jgi:two-component system chemotaxis response regulator CheY